MTALRLMIVTDAWKPQTNGVVRTLDRLVTDLTAQGHAVRVVSPLEFATLPCPTYPEIRLSLAPGRRFKAIVDEFQPTALHLSTEGPLGWAARRWALKNKVPFTTAYHTKFPEYVQARTRLPVAVSYALLRWFHAPSAAVMVPTPSLKATLESRGFKNVGVWGRGVDLTKFTPETKADLPYPRPIFVCSGRVAVEKNLPAFLKLDLPGTKLIIGEGPQLAGLKAAYPNAVFTGYLPDAEMVRTLAASDMFVFPSVTETFGNVILEALACGVPVAAFPVTGPLDILSGSGAGVLDADLRRAALKALQADRRLCRPHAERYTYAAANAQFTGMLRLFTRA
jgi:glycosyltransferase involved in cell wall biosynthesis